MLPIHPPIAPMEARSADAIPEGAGWQYEPKWDGFRCLAFRDGSDVYLQSKAEKPLARYFPELVEQLRALRATQFVLDGEIAVPVAGRLRFEELLMRIHPAASRIRKLSTERPAIYIAFDLLADAKGASLVSRPLSERRRRLDVLGKRCFGGSVRLSPATTSLAQARRWFRAVGANLDGVIAKRLDQPYRAGDRSGMVKVKWIRSVDCVVGGFRYSVRGRIVGSLLLGLYDEEGRLHHVGFTSAIPQRDRAALTARLEKLIRPPGFTGRPPGGISRWAPEETAEWHPLAPELVVEVAYDHFTAGRFRHGTRFLRWRPDKAPKQCTMDQVSRKGGADLRLLE